jgi:ubiquinone biosynthesis protein Coq4
MTLTLEVLRPLSPIRWARVLRALFSAVKTPDVAHFYELETSMMTLASERQLERMAERFRAAPDMKRAFEERYLPRTRAVEEAAACAEGTFGRAYFDFMTRYGLSPEYLAPRTLAGDLTWFRARQSQAHDQWHALLGIGAALPDEVEIVAVLLAQFRRALPMEPLASAFTAMLLVVYLVHTLFTAPRQVLPCLHRLRDGYRRGWNLAPLWALRFEELWDRPLVEVRALVESPWLEAPRGLALSHG